MATVIPNPSTALVEHLADRAAVLLDHLAEMHGNGLVLAYDDGEWGLYPQGLDGERWVSDDVAHILKIGVGV